MEEIWDQDGTTDRAEYDWRGRIRQSARWLIAWVHLGASAERSFFYKRFQTSKLSVDFNSLRTRRSGVRISQGAPIYKGFSDLPLKTRSEEHTSELQSR